ncbi:unnamed protein product [Dovyalis caffra]|uniref:Uncharacterized protein n=1 Tax=Dovyalis caffra TaxID=77055 RepID=A0AAV1RV77_9ROSI|nr:unnamed protein product [Dovyalis caffra]
MAPTKVVSSQVLIVVSSVVVLLLSGVSSFDGNEPKGLKICGFDAIYNFGDSYSDTGNAIQIDPTASQSHPPYGRTINKITGRSNSAGFPSIKTYLNSNETDSLNGVNFAVSGATALPLNVVLSKLNISAGFINNSLTEQLQWFGEHLKGFCQTDCKEKLRSSLFIIGIGSNEYNLGFFHFKKAEEMKKIGLVSAVVEAIQKAVEQVIGYGATRVLVPGTYPTGCAPGFLGMFRKLNYTKDTHGCLADVNDLYKYHNDQLQAGLEILRKKYPGWASLASELDYLSLTFLFQSRMMIDDGDEEDSPCFQSHHHIPKSAIPALMKVFENLKSLEIKICFSQTCMDNSFRLEATSAGSDVCSYLTCVSVPSKAGLLTSSDYTPSSLDAEFGCAHICSFMDFYTLMLKNRSKTLTSLVMMVPSYLRKLVLILSKAIGCVSLKVPFGLVSVPALNPVEL